MGGAAFHIAAEPALRIIGGRLVERHVQAVLARGLRHHHQRGSLPRPRARYQRQVGAARECLAGGPLLPRRLRAHPRLLPSPGLPAALDPPASYYFLMITRCVTNTLPQMRDCM